MKKITISSLLILTLTLTLLPACGGGGGGGTTQPTTAVLTLSTTVTNPVNPIPPNTTINSYDVSITLPEGVTVNTKPNSSETEDGVVTASGQALNASIIKGYYTEASGGLPGTVKIHVYSATGFNDGEFCKVTCHFAAGNPPTAVTPPTFLYPLPDGEGALGWDNSPTAPINPVDLTSQLSLSAIAVIQ